MDVDYLLERYFSSCRLEDVVELIPCRCRRHEYCPVGMVTGMLVRYANGDRACVGSFRFDWAEASCEVGPGGRFWLGCSYEPKMVVAVSNEAPPLGYTYDGLSWVEVPCEGKLEWWFWYYQNEVHHIHDAVK
jgi:hypothetical protein